VQEQVYLDTIEMDVRWGDQDRYGHVNNTVYFRFFEEARVQWLDKIGIPIDGNATGPVVLQTSATFLRPLNYPCRIRIILKAGEPGRSSLPLFHEIIDARNGALYCEGFVKLVWVDHGTTKSTPLPEALVALIRDQRLRTTTLPTE
jgi:acyl-CoA thioester hydrolase